MLTPGDLDREADRVRELTRMADRIRAIDGILIGEDRQRERTEQRIAEAERAIHSLLAEGGAVSESEFFRRAEVFAQRKKVMAELDRTPAGEVPTDDPDLAGIDRMDPDGYRQIQREFDESRERLKAAQSELGALEERIATLSKSEERSRARAREASLSARLEEASEKWAVLTLCRTLLDDTRKVYETERQPTVLKHASEFLSLMSQGSWVRVVSPLDSDELIVESPGGVRVPPENLSRGTAEQLYLAMRLALVREYSDHVEPLPIIFDDIFVNFDPGRARRAIESVGDLARTHQVLIFTCHPHLVELAREVIPGLQVYPLQ
jgi:uncharacterized protein YhaN